MVFDYYLADGVGLQSALLYKESHYVAAGYFFFLSGIEVKCGDIAAYGIVRFSRGGVAAVKFHVFRNVVVLGCDHIYGSGGVNSRRSSVAVCPSLFGERLVVVDD